jgi:O-antigen/teichoic acid export membrane protein
MVAFVAVVANTALLANAHYFLVTFLGKGTGKWLPAETALEILCFYGILRVITEPVGNCIMARGQTKLLLKANAIAGAVELILILLALRSGRIEGVAGAVLFAYFCAGAVLLPFLGREFSIGIGDIAAQVWPVAPALVAGYAATSLLPASFGTSFVTMACRGLFTASVVGLTHGLCTRFRFFHEAGGMISETLVRVRA